MKIDTNIITCIIIHIDSSNAVLYHINPVCRSTQLIIYSSFIFSIFFMQRVQNNLVEIDNYLSKCFEMNGYVNSKFWQWKWISNRAHTFFDNKCRIWKWNFFKNLIYLLCSLKRMFESLQWTLRDQRKRLRVW